MFKKILLVGLMILVVGGMCWAKVPEKMSVQGKLTTGSNPQTLTQINFSVRNKARTKKRRGTVVPPNLEYDATTGIFSAILDLKNGKGDSIDEILSSGNTELMLNVDGQIIVQDINAVPYSLMAKRAQTYTEKPIKYARINYSGGSTKLSYIDDVVIVGLSGMFYGGSGSIGPVAFDVTVSDGGPTDFIKVMESTNVSSAPYYHNLNRSFSVPVKIPKGTSVTVTATQLDSKAYNVYLKDIGVYFIEMPL